MFKKLLSVLLLLVLFTSIYIAKDKKYLLKPNGKKVLLNESSSGEIIKIQDAENTFRDSKYSITGISDTITYRNDGGAWNMGFTFQGQDVMFTWFEAPDDMTIKSIGYACAGAQADTIGVDSIVYPTVGLRIIKLNWSADELFYFGWTYQGVYPSVGDGFNEADPFGEFATGDWVPNVEEPDKLPPWTNNANPELNTWEYDVWPGTGEAWPTVPIIGDPYTWLDLSSTGMGEVSLAKGDIYAVVAVNEGPNMFGDYVFFFADTSISGNHSWKYYEKRDPAGWYVKSPYTFDFAVIADVDESSGPVVEPIAAVRIDANGDFTPDRTGEEVTVEGVITSPSTAPYYYGVKIEDESGAINIYSAGDTLSTFQIGDLVKVTGTVGQYKGLTQISTTHEDIELIEVVGPPEPLLVTIATVNADPEAFESKLIRINGLTITDSGVWPDSAGVNASFMVTDGTDSLKLYLDRDFDIAGNPEPIWSVDIIMNGSQYTTSVPPNDNYSFFPRMYSDFIEDGSSAFSISFECDMSIEIAAGRFNPMSDILSVRGDFNGWSSVDEMLPLPTNPNIYGIEIPFETPTAGESLAYKFAYLTGSGDVWETGANYSYTITEEDINNGFSEVPSRLFNNLSMDDVVQQECMIKFIVDMNPAVDSLFPVIENVFIAGGNQPLQWPGGGWPDVDIDKVIFLSDDGTNGDEVAGDNLWSVDIVFPIYTPLDIQYKYGANWGLPTNGGSNDNEGPGDHHLILYPTFEVGRTLDIFGLPIIQPVIDDSIGIIEPIADVRIDADKDFVPDRTGDEVTVQGIITSPSTAPYYYGVKIEDATGAINIYSAGDTLSTFQIGDLVKVTGTVGQYKGLTQISTTHEDIELIEVVGPPEPLLVTIATVNADPEAFESKLIRINGLTITNSGVWPDSAGVNASFMVTDGTDSLKLYLDRDFDIAGNPEPIWPVDIIMNGSQYTTSVPPNDNYSFFPRMYSDFIEGGGGCTGPDWVPVIYTNSTTAYGRVEIDGLPAEAGDMVGAFVGDECRAVGTVTLNDGEAFVTLLIQGETVETVGFKIFDISECEELNVTYKTETNPGSAIGTPPYYLPIYSASRITQSIALNAGWNLISLNVAPDTTTPEYIFSGIMDKLTDVKSMSESYNPTVPDFLNTLNSLEDGYAYWVKVTENTILDVEGLPIDYPSLTIDLFSGWNLIGYPVDTPNGIEDALSSIWTDFTEAKDLALSYNVSVPDFLNTLRVLEPNRGYWIKTSANVGLVYTAPPTITKQRADVEIVSYDNWKTTFYPNSMVVYTKVEINDAQDVNGLVGAFIDNECRGVGQIISNENESYSTIVINGEKEGKVIFKVFDSSSDTEISIDGSFEFVPGTTKTETILLKGRTEEYVNSLIPTTTRLYYAYPNPFNPSTEIKFDLNKDSDVNLSVYNLKGELVRTITNDKYSAGSYSFRWNGNNSQNGKVSSGVYIINFRANGKSDSKKVVLLK